MHLFNGHGYINLDRLSLGFLACVWLYTHRHACGLISLPPLMCAAFDGWRSLRQVDVSINPLPQQQQQQQQ